MKSYFICVRFDRMKNTDISVLYQQLISISKFAKCDIPELITALTRLEMYKSLTEVLMKKKRKQLHTPEITKLRAANDKLIAAILFQLKALNYAQLDEDRVALLKTESAMKKLLKNYNRNVIQQKENVFYMLNGYLKSEDFKNALVDLRLMRFIDKLNENNAQIDELLNLQDEDKKSKPAPNTTIPAKEKLIAEMRLYLQTIDVYLLTHPEAGKMELTGLINIELKRARTQLRNTTTRRIRRKEKANKEVVIEGNDVSEDNYQ